MKDKTKKAVAIAIIGVAGLGLGAIGGAIYKDSQIQYVPTVDTNALQEAFNLGKNSVTLPDVDALTAEAFAQGLQEGIASVEVTETEVEVDNGNLDLVLDHVYDNDGKVQYLLDDLDDDEVDQIVDRIVFVNDIKQLAVDYVDKELADELDKVVVNGTELDEDDFEKIRLNDDADEVEIDEVDFEDRDATVIVTGKFRHDDVWYNFSSEVVFEDGEIEDFNVIDVEEQ